MAFFKKTLPPFCEDKMDDSAFFSVCGNIEEYQEPHEQNKENERLDITNKSGEELKNIILKIQSKSEEERSEEEILFLDTVVDRMISKVLEKRFKVPDMTLIFQENILVLCQEGAGFSAGEADELRRAIGKKKPELMESYREQFVTQWDKITGWGGQLVWDKIKGFASYGFNKSHAVAYTLISLMTAEMQMNHFEDFMSFNYKTQDSKHKDIIIGMVAENGRLKFPTWRDPFKGVIAGSGNNQLEFSPLILEGVNVEDIEIPDDPKKLFLADIPGDSNKMTLICRGVYDCISTDIKGLIELNKTLGVKKRKGYMLSFYENNKLEDFLKVMGDAGWIKWDIVDRDRGIYKFGSIKKYDPENCYNLICRDVIQDGSRDSKSYRAKKLIKEFGMFNPNGLSISPADYIEKGERAVEIINKYWSLYKERNETKGSKKEFEALESKNSRVYDLKNSLKNDNVYYAFVKDKKVKSYCSVDLVFEDGKSMKFFTRSDRIIKDVDKNDIIAITVEYKYYYSYKTNDIVGFKSIELVKN